MQSAVPAAIDRVADEELARRYATNGDREALGELIGRYTPRLRRLLVSLLGRDEETVADAEQEIYVLLLRRLDRFRGDSSFATFFYALARNRAFDILREKRRTSRRTRDPIDPDRLPSALRGPEHAADASSRAEMVRAALERLSPTDRFLVYLKDGEGERVERLSEITGMPQGTVKSRLARARRRLASYLEELGYER